MRCCDCEFRNKCDDTQKVLTAFVKCYRREEFLKKENGKKTTNAVHDRMVMEQMTLELIARAEEAEKRAEKAEKKLERMKNNGRIEERN